MENQKKLMQNRTVVYFHMYLIMKLLKNVIKKAPVVEIRKKNAQFSLGENKKFLLCYGDPKRGYTLR